MVQMCLFPTILHLQSQWSMMKSKLSHLGCQGEFYLGSQALWNVVISEADSPPLRENPNVSKIKANEEKKLKKNKAITCFHS